MKDPATSWLDDRLDGDRRWIAADSAHDVDVDDLAAMSVDQPVEAGGGATSVIADEVATWLAEDDLSGMTVPDLSDAIVLDEVEINEAIDAFDGETGAPWEAHGWGDGLVPPTGADTTIDELGIASADTAGNDHGDGLVDPFDAFVAVTDSETGAAETDATESDGVEPDAAAYGDDIAPVGGGSGETADSLGESTVGDPDTAHQLDSEPGFELPSTPLSAPNTLDAFDAFDPVTDAVSLPDSHLDDAHLNTGDPRADGSDDDVHDLDEGSA